MINNTNAQLNAYQVSNSSLNDVNSSVKVRNSSLYGTNSSFNGKVINIADKINKIVKNLSIFGARKTDVTGVVTHFSTSNDSEKQSFTSDDNKRYHGCTTEHSASNPRRHSLDIFVPKTYLVNTQQVTTGMNKLVLRFKRYTYGTGHSDVSCDGMSEPNKIPLWGNKFRGLNVVVVIPFYPFFTIYNKHTKHSGGHYHA